MSWIRLIGIVALWSVPCTAWAQPWADAYRSGDYRKAVDLLQPLMLDEGRLSTDPGPARHLAILYAQGLGVPRDPVVACAMAQHVRMARPAAAPNSLDALVAYKALVEEGERFFHELCDGLTPPELATALRARACPAFGMPDEMLTLGSQTVAVSRAGMRIGEAPLEQAMPFFNCPQIVARCRGVTVSPPGDGAPGIIARHFIELLVWGVGRESRDGALRFILRRQMYELRRETIKLVSMTELYSSDTYPGSTLPADFDARHTLEMIRSGHVRLRTEGTPPKLGWIMLPEDAR